MKICTNCDALTSDSTNKCPGCHNNKFKDFVNSTSSPNEHVRIIDFYSTSSTFLRSKTAGLVNNKNFLATAFVVSLSAALAAFLIFSGPSMEGNISEVPSDLPANELPSATTTLTDGFEARVDAYQFVDGSELMDPPGKICTLVMLCSVDVYIFNLSDAPIEFPLGVMCLKTNRAHYASLQSYTPEAPSKLINPGSPETANLTSFVFERPFLSGTWSPPSGEVAEEYYYGECGKPETAWFRFKLDPNLNQIGSG